MKTIKYISFCCCVLLCSTLNAQIKVESSGKVKIGNDSTNYPIDSNDVASLMIFGKYGEYKAGGKLSFGDFGTTLSGVPVWNVFVGEYGTTDSDKLWLSGRNGIYLTCGNQGENIIGYYSGTTTAGNFVFNCDVKSQGILLTSDERFKKDIKKMTGALSQLQQLKGVRYHYDFSNTEYKKNQSPITKGNEIHHKDNYRQRIGFLAQELQNVLPELVDKDSSGYFHVDYIGLIPVIVESIKEQQQIIDAQSKKIKELEQKNNDVRNLRSAIETDETNGTDTVNTNLPHAFLYQNAPNPFQDNTEIRYFLPEEVHEAYLCIFDMQGKMLKKLNTQAGMNTITVRGSELQAGMYLYSLIADGKEVDTKRMILTK